MEYRKNRPFAAAKLNVRWLAARAIEADVFERLVDFFEGLFAEIRDAEQVFARAIEQVVDCKDAALFEAVGGADGEADFGRAHLEFVFKIL
jgi:hypothetical protein